ncbi:MAG: hypothetical protein AB1916_16650 [Thermodesulfobacteriota bacterium]
MSLPSPLPPRPLVMGYPRMGFSLLISVLICLGRLTPRPDSPRTRLLRALTQAMDNHVSNAVVGVFARAGLAGDLAYNANFRALLGGPKWLHPDDPSRACFRKYIGVRGMGDMALVMSHPCQVLNCDPVVHSHSHPGRWLEHPAFAGHVKLASVRNPAGTVSSACFSINALASEYIQRFLPPERDNDDLRKDLALYKLTNLDFFRGLVTPMKAYLEEYLDCRDRFAGTMRWEDLLTHPVRTILQVAEWAGIDCDADFAGHIWDGLAYRNLTGAHRHNFRQGQAKTDGWRKALVNAHLDILRQEGIDRLCLELGYGPIADITAAEHTPFQTSVQRLLDKGEIHAGHLDRDLFCFAFNKSNLDSSKFPFRRYPWRAHTRMERSCFADEALQNKVWDAAEEAAGQVNAVFRTVLDVLDEDGNASRETLLDAVQASDADPALLERAVRALEAATGRAERVPPDAGRIASRLGRPVPLASCDPLLVCAVGGHNIVLYAGVFYAIPHETGPLDLATDSVLNREGVLVATTLGELRALLDARPGGAP